MIQAVGLTSRSRDGAPPAVDDLTFEARAGEVTVLLGPEGAGKTSAVMLMLQLRPGRGVTLFRGRPVARIPHLAREVGLVLGDVPGHPARSAAGHMRMLAAGHGVPAQRADEVLDVVGLSGLADERLDRFSRGMDRRLAVAVALLGDPHTLILDEPAAGLGRRESAWLHGLVRGYAEQGGTVLCTSASAREAAEIGDRVVTLDRGRLVADQVAADFTRTRLRPRVVVRTPHPQRLAAVLRQEMRAAGPVMAPTPAELVVEDGQRLAVYGSSCPVVGEIAYRHAVPIHLLAEETTDQGDHHPPDPLQRADGRAAAGGHTASGAERGGRARPTPSRPTAAPSRVRQETRPPGGRRRRRTPGEADGGPPGPPGLPGPPGRGPSRPLRYELRRLTGLRDSWLLMTAAVLAGILGGVALAATGGEEASRVVHGWPSFLPLPPSAVAAGILGALSFGHEFRYPALHPGRAPTPRRLGLLAAKLVVTGGVAAVLAGSTAAVNAVAVPLLTGSPVEAGAPAEGVLRPALWAVTTGPAAVMAAVGCGWAGLLAAGVFRSTWAGVGAVAAVPWLLAPALRLIAASPVGETLHGAPGRLWSFTGATPPAGGVDDMIALGRFAELEAPVTWALAATLAALLGGFLCLARRSGRYG